MIIIIETVVDKIERKRHGAGSKVVGKDANGNKRWEVQYEDKGWYVKLDGSWESNFVSMDPKTTIRKGQRVIVKMEIEDEGVEPSADPND